MAPIRLALIGLSQSAKTSWASQAHLPYLLSSHGKQRYRIAALLNSSREAAQRSIESYALGSDVKAYGSPHDLAADPDIDLVVCVTRVDVHYDAVKPSLAAGKNVYVEWPLAENVGRARELYELAQSTGSKTMVGLQMRTAPPVAKVQELLGSGAVGRVVSSDVQAFTPGSGGFTRSEGLAYFLDKKIGGNSMTIAVGHMTDYIHSVLGEYATSHSHTQIQRPNQTIINPDTKTERPTTSDVPDLLCIHGTLAPPFTQHNHLTDPKATLTITFRTGPPFPGTSSFIWTITGDRGELRITCTAGPFLVGPVTIELHTFGEEEVKEEQWDWEDWQKEIEPVRSREIAKLYSLWYEGKVKEARAADFEAAVARHERVDAMIW